MEQTVNSFSRFVFSGRDFEGLRVILEIQTWIFRDYFDVLFKTLWASAEVQSRRVLRVV